MEYIYDLEIISSYDFDDAFSINELLCKFWEKLEDVINVSNECIDILNWLKEEGAPTEIEKIITELVKDGTIEQMINVNKIEELRNLINIKYNEMLVKHNEDVSILFNTLPLESCGTKFFAHRGMSEICPENTIPAYEMASKNNFYGVETDVAVTSDGQFILMHDDTIDRTTTGTGRVESLTYGYIKSLTINGGNNYTLYPGTKVPSLAEFLICCKKNNLIPILELKQNFNLDYIESFINEVKKYGMIDKCYVLSFSSTVLQKIREFNSRVKMIIIHTEYREDFLNWAVTLKNCGFGIGSTNVTQEQIAKCHNNGVFVAIWTVNDYHKAKRLIDFGVDFIISDKIRGVN